MPMKRKARFRIGTKVYVPFAYLLPQDRIQKVESVEPVGPPEPEYAQGFLYTLSLRDGTTHKVHEAHLRPVTAGQRRRA